MATFNSTEDNGRVLHVEFSGNGPKLAIEYGDNYTGFLFDPMESAGISLAILETSQIRLNKEMQEAMTPIFEGYKKFLTNLKEIQEKQKIEDLAKKLCETYYSNLYGKDATFHASEMELGLWFEVAKVSLKAQDSQ